MPIFFFVLTTWLGLYLLAREPTDWRLRWTGVGLLVYALLFAGQVVLDTWLVEWLLAIGLVLFGLDLILAWRGVLQVREAFWPDLFRSLDAAALFALLFGAPVALTMTVATGVTPAMRLLLLVTLTLALATQVFAEPIQRGLDRFAFPRRAQLQQTRAELRATAEALPKVDETVEVLALDEAEFSKLTRRALSHYGDLPRLSASPLTHLPVISARLAARNAADTTLERAAELKRLLHEAICHLKPPGETSFSPTDAWRHYNALYFPYVLGLKPYNRRADHSAADPASQEALDWLRTQVPERTLYNWQTAAAKLVAQYLREQ
ncbi:MAG: hypothetical protein R3E79_56935 [Caldilineaceae bacterium]